MEDTKQNKPKPAGSLAKNEAPDPVAARIRAAIATR